jgi:PAS domain S-box-containing protein
MASERPTRLKPTVHPGVKASKAALGKPPAAATDATLWMLAELMPSFLAFVDSGFRYRAVNEGYERFAGLPADQIIGRTVRQVLGEEAWRTIKPHAVRVVRGQRERFRSSVQTASGLRHLRVDMVPIRERGRVCGYFVLGTDLPKLLSPEPAVAAIDGYLGRLLSGPRASLPPLQAAHRDRLLERASELLGQMRASGAARKPRPSRAAAAASPPEPKLIAFPTKGQLRPRGWPKGSSLEAVEQRWMVEALQSSRQRLELLIARLPVGLIVWDTDFLVREWNPAATQIFGYTDKQAFGMHGSAIIPDADRESVDAVWAKLLKRAGGESLRNRNLRRDGRTIYCDWFNTPLIDGGKVIGVASMVRDITAEEEAQKEIARYRDHLEQLVQERSKQLQESSERLREAERLAAMGTLATGLGHDINNLLLPIRLSVDSLLAVGDAGADAGGLSAASEQLATLKRSVEFLSQLAAGLLSLEDASQEGAARQARVKLSEWWAKDGAMLRAAIPPTARLRTDLRAGVPDPAIAPEQLSRAVLNLITNAVEASASASIFVWTRAEGDPQGGEATVAIGVTDDGPGMDERVRRRAREPFFTTKKRQFTTGLGLSLVHAIARACGGSVRIDSAPGSGTTVVLLIPAARAETSARRARRASGGKKALTRVAVGVADSRIAGFLRLWLETHGYVHVAAEGRSPDAEVWMTDAHCASLEAIQAFLQRGSRRRVMVCGPVPRGWRVDRLEPIPDPGDAAELARAFARAQR